MIKISYRSLAIFSVGIAVGLWVVPLLNLLSWYI